MFHRKSFFFILFCGILLLPAALPAKSISAFVNYSLFYAPDGGNFIEVDVMALAPSLVFVKTPNGKYKASVEMLLLVKKNNEVVAFDKNLLHSLEVDDTLSAQMSLRDKKRYAVGEGAYTLEVQFTDANHRKSAYTYTETFLVDFNSEKASLSDVMLLDSYQPGDEDNAYTRNGMYMITSVLNYFPNSVDRLTFYVELYNSDKLPEGKGIVTAFVRKINRNEPVGNLSFYKKISGAPVHPILAEFDISNLYTGNYYLSVQVRDKDNTLVALKEQFFQRNKIMEPDSLEDMAKVFIENTFVESFTPEVMTYQLKSILPIAGIHEGRRIKELIKGKDHGERQRYFLAFWIKRDAANPQGAWMEYAATLKIVNDQYGTPLRYGFETDRGRVFLQYGPPSDVVKSPREPGAYPYDIWRYNLLNDGQTNVRFVFYNPDMVTNDYTLIHSTAIGEIKNEHWQRLVYQTFTGGNSPTESGTEIRDHYGTKATDYFKNE